MLLTFSFDDWHKRILLSCCSSTHIVISSYRMHNVHWYPTQLKKDIRVLSECVLCCDLWSHLQIYENCTRDCITVLNNKRAILAVCKSCFHRLLLLIAYSCEQCCVWMVFHTHSYMHKHMQSNKLKLLFVTAVATVKLPSESIDCCLYFLHSNFFLSQAAFEPCSGDSNRI